MIIGVDIDSYKATLAAVPFAGGKPILAEARWRPDRATGEALSVLEFVPEGIRLGVAELRSAPGYRFDGERNVWFVERGFGASRRSDFIIGAFTGAVVATLVASRVEEPVNLMEAREWKAEVTGVSGIGLTKAGRGNGNAKKEIANEACRALLESLDEVETTDWTPDQLDAWGIAFTGRRLNARASGGT